MQQMTGHAPIAPSSLARIVQCPGSYTMALPYLDAPPTDDTLEGDAAHWVAMFAASFGAAPPAGTTAPNGWLVDQDMVDAAEVYCEALESREGIPGVAEETVRITRIHGNACWGTPDFRQYSKANRRLRVTDFKYGHRYVEVFGNWQLIAYAAGILEEFKHEMDEDLDTVEFVIVQPRCYAGAGPIRTWTVKATALRPLVSDAFHAAFEALSGNGKLQTGPECRDCPARHACPALRTAASAWMEYAGKSEPELHDAGDIGRELHMLLTAIDRLKARACGLEEMALGKAKAGANVPFFKIEEAKHRQVWNKPATDILAMAELVYGPEMRAKLEKPTQLITPKQAIKAKFDESVITAYSFTPRGSLKLVPDNLTEAKRIFS